MYKSGRKASLALVLRHPHRRRGDGVGVRSVVHPLWEVLKSDVPVHSDDTFSIVFSSVPRIFLSSSTLRKMTPPKLAGSFCIKRCKSTPCIARSGSEVGSQRPKARGQKPEAGSLNRQNARKPRQGHAEGPCRPASKLRTTVRCR